MMLHVILELLVTLEDRLNICTAVCKTIMITHTACLN